MGWNYSNGYEILFDLEGLLCLWSWQHGTRLLWMPKGKKTKDLFVLSLVKDLHVLSIVSCYYFNTMWSYVYYRSCFCFWFMVHARYVACHCKSQGTPPMFAALNRSRIHVLSLESVLKKSKRKSLFNVVCFLDPGACAVTGFWKYQVKSLENMCSCQQLPCKVALAQCISVWKWQHPWINHQTFQKNITNLYINSS